MGLEKDWLSMGSTSVRINALSTMDGYGAPVFSTAGSTYDAIFEESKKIIPRPDGRTEVSSHIVYVLSTSATISMQDQLTVPGTSEQPRILGVDHVRDDKGQHHVELLIG